MPYANAHVELMDNNVYLFSYRTLVAQIENDWLTINGLYSNTTKHHISAFLKEYASPIDFHTAKIIYQDKEMINILTGEVEEQ